MQVADTNWTTDVLLCRSFSWWHKWRWWCSRLSRFLVKWWAKWYGCRWWTTDTPEQAACYKVEFLVTGVLFSITQSDKFCYHISFFRLLKCALIQVHSWQRWYFNCV